MKKIIILIIILICISSCRSYESTSSKFDSSKEIRILYTNILPPSVDPIKFYASVKQKKIECLNYTPNVALIDTGNFLNSNNGLYNSYIDIMNNVGYDYATLGLYDFKNGLDYVYNNTNKANFKFLLSDLSYNGQKKDIFKKTVPFDIVNYDGIKVGYVGVFNPRSGEEKPEYFYEDGKTVVNFYNETVDVFYDTVQCSIEKVKNMGAQYVVLITNLDTSNLNIENNEYYYLLEDLVSNISDIDVVINGNEYTQTEEMLLKDKEFKDVFVISNGPSDTNFGIITIDNGNISNEIISNYLQDLEFEDYFNKFIK